MLQAGLVSVTFRRHSPQEIIALVAEANLRGIEWGGDVHVPPGEITLAKTVRQQTADAGLVVPSYGSYYRVAESEKAGLAFEKVLDSAVALGAATIRVWAGHRASTDADATYRVGVVEDTLRIAALAATADVSISFEYHGQTLTDSRASNAELRREIQHENVHFYWQPLPSIPPEEQLESLRETLPRLSNIHAYYNQKIDDRQEARPLAEGEPAWGEFIAQIKGTGRDHFVMLEFVRAESVAQFHADAATLKAWLSL